MTILRIAAVLLASCAACLAGSCCCAAPMSDPGEALHVRIYSVADLECSAGSVFLLADEEWVPDMDVSDEDNPLFGPEAKTDDGASDGPGGPTGAEMNALMDLLRRETGGDQAWRPPAWLRKQGPHTLVAQNTPNVLDRLGDIVDRWRHLRVAAKLREQFVRRKDDVIEDGEGLGP